VNSSIRIELELTPKEIDQLREVMDAQPLRPYAPLILKVLSALPLESNARHDLTRRRGSFQLRALTPRGASMVDALDAVLARLPHTGDV